MDILRSLALATITLGASSAAQAHVAVQPSTVPAGSYQVLRFGVGHGCDGKATTAVRIEIPPGVESARPQPKPGWKLSIEHGSDKAVTAIAWQGELPADQFDELLIQVKLPAAAGPLAFPAIQSCGAAEARWTDPVPPGGPRPQHPAPTLTLTPAATPGPNAAPAAPPEGGHDHHH